MARRYGKIPSELLELDLDIFNLNMAIMFKSMDIEAKSAKAAEKPKHNLSVKDGKLRFGDFSLEKIVKGIKKKKRNK